MLRCFCLTGDVTGEDFVTGDITITAITGDTATAAISDRTDLNSFDSIRCKRSLTELVKKERSVPFRELNNIVNLGNK